MNSPRSQRRLPRRAGNYYLRLAGIAGGGCLIAYVLFIFIAKVIHPYQMGFSVERDIRTVRAELKKQQAKNTLLARRLDYLKTPEGAETEARRAGYSRPGEIVYLLRSAASASSSSNSATPAH